MGDNKCPTCGVDGVQPCRVLSHREQRERPDHAARKRMTDTPTPASDEGLVERVARAIAPNLFRLYPSGQSASHERARNQARAAIKELSK